MIVIVGLAAAFVYVENKEQLTSPLQKSLAFRIESIPIERICEAITTGRQILGDDHVTVWSDEKRYLVVGWQADHGQAVVYWTGADLPIDQPGCKGRSAR
jgi:hypothetical protein